MICWWWYVQIFWSELMKFSRKISLQKKYQNWDSLWLISIFWQLLWSRFGFLWWPWWVLHCMFVGLGNVCCTFLLAFFFFWLDPSLKPVFFMWNLIGFSLLNHPTNISPRFLANYKEENSRKEIEGKQGKMKLLLLFLHVPL